MMYPYLEHTPDVHATAYIAPTAELIGRVTVGEASSVWYGTVIRGDDNYVRIGKRTNIQDNCTLHIAGDEPTILGDDVTVGHGAIVHACEIADRVLIGMGAIILNGAKIGANTIVAAGSVVTPGTEIPSGSMVMGTPGKVVRALTEEEIAHIAGSAEEYVRLARAHAETKGGEAR